MEASDEYAHAEPGAGTGIVSSLDISNSSSAVKQIHAKSAHRTNHDSWYQIGTLLAVSFNSGYVLSFSNLVLRSMGWTWGIVNMFVLAVMSFFANCLLAHLHEIEGKRFIRYRDLARYALGMKICHAITFLQLMNFVLANMGFLLLAGRALKEIHMQSGSSSSISLQEFIIISGGICFVFAIVVPNLSRLRIWIGISGLLTAIYMVIVFIVSISDGRLHSKSYKVVGTKAQKIFNGLNGIAAIMAMNNSGMTLELQATAKKPAIQNMWKALGLQFSGGMAVYCGVTIVGYWAYGSSVSEYLLNNLSGPKWAKLLANAAMFLQTIVSQHMFCSPVHEILDTKYSYLEKKEFSAQNIWMRVILRGAFYSINTFAAAMFPFIGDFVNLLGSLALIPLTFIFPSLIYIKIKGGKLRMVKAICHHVIIVFFSLVTVATAISSGHSIVKNARTYKLFANT